MSVASLRTFRFEGVAKASLNRARRVIDMSGTHKTRSQSELALPRMKVAEMQLEVRTGELFNTLG